MLYLYRRTRSFKAESLPSYFSRVLLQSQNLCEVIDRLGAASAKAQSLPAIITTSSKLAYTDQRIYIFLQHDTDR